MQQRDKRKFIHKNRAWPDRMKGNYIFPFTPTLPPSRGRGKTLLDKEESHLHTGLKIQRRGDMNVLWIVNTNTFLLILLIIMVSYLTTQVNALIRWLKRE